MQAHSLSNRAANHPHLPPSFPPPPSSPQPTSISAAPGLAHDAGNLLAALRLYTDLLAAPGVLAPQHAHYAHEIRLVTDRTSAWIARLLEGEAVRPPKTVSAAFTDGAEALRLLEPVLLQLALPHANLTLHTSLGLLPLPFPAEVLERITLNLVRNAVDAIASQRGRTEPGEIVVALRLFAGRLELIVEDNGPGLNAFAAARLLQGGLPCEPPVSGRGLGHAIVRELAHQTGAAIEVRGAPHCGTSITLRWRADGLAGGLEPNQGASAAC